jgi:hypothetical protein
MQCHIHGAAICGRHLLCETRRSRMDIALRLTPSLGGLDRVPTEQRRMGLAMMDYLSRRVPPQHRCPG